MPINDERARKLMHRQGVEALVASSTENVYYVSDYWSQGRQLGCGTQSYALLPLDGEPGLVAPLSEADLVVDSGTWIGDVAYYGCLNIKVTGADPLSEPTQRLMEIYRGADPIGDSCSALVRLIEARGLTKATIALDTSGTTPGRFENIKRHLPEVNFVEGADLLREVRSVKTEEEVARIQRATEITEKSMEDALEIARSDIMEVDLASMFSYSVAYDGGRVTYDFIGIGERSAYPNPVPTTLAAGRSDIIRMTLGCVWSHYHSNISRTALIGRPDAEAKKRWNAVQEAQEEALGAVRAGARVSEVYSAAERVLGESGLEKCSDVLGHCLGVECNEQPVLEKGNDRELIEGMVLNVDIPYLDLGWGGFQLEDTVLVTADGYRLLTNTDRTLYLL